MLQSIIKNIWDLWALTLALTLELIFTEEFESLKFQGFIEI